MDAELTQSPPIELGASHPDRLVSTTPDAQYEAQVLAWIDERIKEGEAIIREEPAYDEADKSISYIMGDQMAKDRPSTLSNCPDNRLKDMLNQTVAALTDIHPLFGFKTYNDAFKDQESVLMKLSQAWWVNTFADLKLADVIKFSAGIGIGYCEVAWDGSLYNGTGDIVIRPLDPRDILPIAPNLGGGIQDWGGLIIRTAKSPDEMKVRFPHKAHLIKADNSPSIYARTWGRARKIMSRIITPSAADVSNAKNAHNSPRRLATTDVYTTYIKDHSLWMGSKPVIMGDPQTTWSYTVYPVDWPNVPNGTDSMGEPLYRKATLDDAKLYPRGRMIISTKTAILYDGPNPYWHGMFPVAKLSLDPWPWSLWGLGLTHDLMPLQDALNEMLNGILDHMRKVLRPAVVADKKSVANSMWDRIDTRLPGLKLRTNASAGKTVEFVSPEPLPNYTFEVLQFLVGEMDYKSGTPNMSSLMQLQQVPGENTIEKMQEAMSPQLRLKGRLLEYFLREVGEMVKACFFQFYNMPRRVAMLGPAGIAFNDFDFDPGTLVPSLSPSDTGYEPQLDKSIPRATRAQWFHKSFTFQITPNSLLAISQISRKLMYLQLRQMQLVDRWTLYDVLEIPNGGTPPNGAETITERMMAEMMLAATAPMAMMAGGAEGRPPSFQESPTLQQKTSEDGVTPRQTISSSGSGGEPPSE
jgi:hypothetical protein